MLSCIFWIWNLNHKQFKILAKFWRWNHTKTTHQLIVINFSSLLPNNSFCPRQNAHFFHLIYHFFFYFEFWLTSFFSFFYNTSTCLNPEFHNFSPTNFNLIRKNSQHRIKNRGILILELKTVWRNFKNTMELMYKNLYGSITQIWTQI